MQRKGWYSVQGRQNQVDDEESIKTQSSLPLDCTKPNCLKAAPLPSDHAHSDLCRPIQADVGEVEVEVEKLPPSRLPNRDPMFIWVWAGSTAET